ncbi:hypothetical protein E2C01_064220 [Portunus trituberculatus]|uniref:Uncharacterized protein n=1 Tax=Portunus trituberculatus TaxID=210409 RepID=A0A5B7HMN5_PORTR|nr:hypothetical protein [Portunus trituberculatus]
MDECHNSEDVMAGTAHHWETQRSSNARSPKHLPARMAQKNSEAEHHSSSDRPSYQHLQFARYLSMAVFTRVLDSGAPRSLLACHHHSPHPIAHRPSLLLLPTVASHPSTQDTLFTNKSSHIVASFPPTSGRGSGELKGGD